MTKQRFEELTGIYISEYQYGIIEEFYLQDGYSEEEFCNRYKKMKTALPRASRGSRILWQLGMKSG